MHAEELEGATHTLFNLAASSVHISSCDNSQAPWVPGLWEKILNLLVRRLVCQRLQQYTCTIYIMFKHAEAASSGYLLARTLAYSLASTYMPQSGPVEPTRYE